MDKHLMKMRTSESDPIRIAEIAVAGGGMLGISFCPGKKDKAARWDRDLDIDLDAIQAWGATAVLTLIEPHEFALLQVTGLNGGLKQRGIAWFHFPIQDVCVPDDRFEKNWQRDGLEIRDLLRNGKRVLVHCRGGLGRAGTIAACMLIELGVPAPEAIVMVRAVRPGAIETSAQEAFVHSYRRRRIERAG